MKARLYGVVSTVETILRRRAVAVAAALVLLGASLRLYWLTRTPLSLDETFTALYASKPWGELTPFLAKYDVHPPLFFAFTRFFVDLLGDDAWGLRLPAALAGIVALPLLYRGAADLAAESGGRPDRLAGVIALSLGVLSSVHIAQSWNARAYSTMFLAMALVTAGAAWLVRNPTAVKTPFWRRDGQPAIPALLVISGGLLLVLWSHNVGVLFAGATGLALIAVWALAYGGAAGVMINFGAVALVSIIGWLPLLPVLFRQAQSVTSDYWIPAPTVPQLIALLMSIFGDADEPRDFYPWEVFFAGAVAVLGLYGLIGLMRRKQRGAFLLLFGLIVGGLGLFLGFTYLVRPVLIDRTVMPLLAPWLVLVAVGISMLRPPLRGVVWALCLISTGISTAQRIQAPPENVTWPFILRTVAENSEGRPLIVTVPNSPSVALSYFLARTDFEVTVAPLPGPFPTLTPDKPYPTGWPGVPAITAESLLEVDKQIAAATGDVWLLLRGYWIYDPDAELRRHFDRDFCYHLLNIPKTPYFFLLKLVPRSAGKDCTSFEPNSHYPYHRPEQGDMELVGTE